MMRNTKNSLSKLFSGIWTVFKSFIAPSTPRGRIRRSIALIIVLLVFAGNLSYPQLWNSATERLNGWSETTLGFDLKLPKFWELPYVLGLDLQGGTHLVYIADMSSIPDAEQDASIAGVRDVIERRVNSFGVSEPLIQTNRSGEDWRLIVDLAGVSDISEAIRLIGETPILEFKEQNDQPPRDLTPEESADLEAKNKEAELKANVLLGRIRDGSDFGQIAAEFSDDTDSKTNGGDIGFQAESGPYGELVETVLSDGVTEGNLVQRVVEDYNGYHVVRYEGRRDGPEQVKASHILICWAGATGCVSERSEDEARALAEELITKVTTENFSELAQENSDDSGTAANGGDLDWFQKNVMIQDFEEAVWALSVGQITSQPVKTDFGYHIIYKTDQRTIPEYHLKHILVKKKVKEDYVPPVDAWKNTQLSGQQLERSTVQFHPQTNEPQVVLEFNSEGKELFADLTSHNVGKPIAIFLDGEPISIPTVNETIPGGEAVITGNFSIQEAKLLAQRLNAGALPVPIQLETQQSVGATLGRDSLDTSLKAGLIGFLIVALFMLLYYRLPGLVAVVALIIYTVVNLAIYKLVPVTLTLSGIAGLILSVGMAVDANILIFERLKEELRRGRTLKSALEEGFRRAWPSIRDSNLTTIISCVILFYTSSSLIKGFAFTLGIGVLVSMFSAIVVSRSLLRLVAGWKPLQSRLLYLPGFHSDQNNTSNSNQNLK